MGIRPKCQPVAPIAEQSDPFGVAHDDVELVAMHDEIAATVGTDVDEATLNGDAAECRPAILAHGFVVIAGNVDELGALADLAQ